jgi:hypothetical protein
MQLLISFALCVLAVYRVAYDIAYSDGPFDIYSWWREKVGQTTWIGRGFQCPICLSWWLSAIAALYLAESVVQFVLYWLAVAGAALVLHKVVKRL